MTWLWATCSTVSDLDLEAVYLDCGICAPPRYDEYLTKVSLIYLQGVKEIVMQTRLCYGRKD